MPDTAKATPRSWFLDEDGYTIRQQDVGGKVIAECQEYAVGREACPANAALIVHAVNCHDELVAALRRSLSHISDMTIRGELREVLAKAEAE